MRGRKQERSGVFALGERSVRNFFFEHPMATYAAALAYRGLFGLFPFLFILVVLLGALGFPDFFDRAMDQARAQSSKYVPQQLEPVVEPAREQVQPLLGMIERAPISISATETITTTARMGPKASESANCFHQRRVSVT